MRLLIIGSLAGQLGAASRIAIERGATVLQADDNSQALTLLREGKGVDLVLADVRTNVPSLMVGLQSERMAVPVVACGVGNDTRAAVAAIKAGAREYLPLPPDPELIAAILAAITEDSRTLLHADPRMAEILRLARRIAASEASVLVVGPSGTGKELMARFLHDHSRRARGRFVAVNCAAIPDTLLEPELFGHEKGAFTGAVARRIGRFEEANGGTLLLDEVSEMDPRLQAKLLRALQEREINRLGSQTPIRIDVRIIATSNRNLAQEVACGRFRADLYYRLNVVTIELPALCERRADIPLLARHFAERYAQANGLPPVTLSAEAERKLIAYHWPGNVRELENILHRAVLVCANDTIGPEAIMLPEERDTSGRARASIARDTGRPAEGALIGRTVADVERDLIIDTLRHCLGNRTHAATILGISIRTLRNKLRQYADEGMEVAQPTQPAVAAAHGPCAVGGP